MDRYLYEYEPDEGVGAGADAGAALSDEAAAAPGAAEAEAASSSATTETAPTWTPEQITALREQPEFRDYIAQEASSIAEARFNALTQRGEGQLQPQAEGQQFDANEFLNPFGDNYGQNMLQLIQQSNQQLLGQVQQLINPLTERYESDTASQSDELLKDAITDLATREGELGGGAAAVQRVIDDVRNRYYPETSQMYGETNRAAEIAIEKAVRAERTYQKQIADAAVEQYKNQLGTLAGARTEPGAGGAAAETFPDTPLVSGSELAFKYGQQATALRGVA